MAALTKDTPTTQAFGDHRYGPVAAGVVCYAGAALVRTAAGFIQPATTAVGNVGVGVCRKRADNALGADGDIQVEFDHGTWHLGNSTAADEITEADRGKLCYFVDDCTVARTDGGGTRSPAGFVDFLRDGKVAVRIDAAVTNAALL